MALNPWQTAIEQLALSMGLKGQAQQQVYQTPEFQNLITQFFGNIALPAGVQESQVTSRSGSGLEYTDAEGYTHRLERDISGVSPRLGQVAESSTNRPAVLPLNVNNPIAPNNQQQLDLNNLIQQVLTSNPSLPLFSNGGNAQAFQQANQPQGEFYGLPTVDANGNVIGKTQPAQANPQSYADVIAALAQMSNAENMANQQNFNQQTGTAVAQLVGNGVGGSSIAGNILSQLLQGQGLVQAQTQANQANRQLQVGQFLAGLEQNRQAQLQEYVLSLLGMGTNRDISNANVNVQQQQVTNQNDQYYRSLQEQMRQFDEQLRMQERQNIFNNIMRGVAVGGSLLTGGLTGGSGGLFGGSGAAQQAATSIGTYAPGGYYDRSGNYVKV